MFRCAIGSLFIWTFACVTLQAQEPADDSSPPATAEQAAAVLDLSTFPCVDPAGEPNVRVIAAQSYSSRGTVPHVFDKIRSELLAAGFQELEGASQTAEYASATYRRAGFSVSLAVMPGSTPETVSVSLNNHGNVDLASLPVPAAAKQLYAFPTTVAYVTELSVAEANDECRRLLENQGWQPFGITTVSFFVKKNAVRLQVMIQAAPAQDGSFAAAFSVIVLLLLLGFLLFAMKRIAPETAR